jgi:predicted dehydrogenase
MVTHLRSGCWWTVDVHAMSGGGQLKVGVVGCGYWGSKHVRVLHAMPEVSEVVAVDPFEERLHSLKQAFPGLAMYPYLESALDHVDAVIIATPPSTHAALALTALASGKSVLVEKPLATSTRDARQLIDAGPRRSLVMESVRIVADDPAVP